MVKANTSSVFVNGEWRHALIWSSDEPMTFSNPEVHIVKQETPISVFVTIYNTDRKMYAYYPPTDMDNKHYYWFLIKSAEQMSASVPQEIIQENEELKKANNILMGLEDY